MLYYIIESINNKAVISRIDKNSYNDKHHARMISFYFSNFIA